MPSVISGQKNVKDNLKQYDIFKSIIPRKIRLAEAPSHGLPINLYDPKSQAAEAYRDLADEMIRKNRRNKNKKKKD